MEERMRALEDALAIAQAQESSLPHELLLTPFKLDDDDKTEDRSSPPNDQSDLDDIANVLGTLHINEKDKVVRFFGPTGGVEVTVFHSAESTCLKLTRFSESAYRKFQTAFDFFSLLTQPLG